jgi:hypothetical protein
MRGSAALAAAIELIANAKMADAVLSVKITRVLEIMLIGISMLRQSPREKKEREAEFSKKEFLRFLMQAKLRPLAHAR